MYVYYCIEMAININISITHHHVIVTLNRKIHNELYSTHTLTGIQSQQYPVIQLDLRSLN